MSLFKLLSNQLLKIRFVQDAVADPTDLSIFREKPTPKMISGFICIIVSYIICWPVISVLGIISLYLKMPLIVIFGGTLIWGFSHLLCMFGLYLAGAQHSKVFLKWITRLFIEKLSSLEL
ncbi:MAG: hypothetical protein PF482_13250 [Desulfobacteraceae bacterium]|nr:hypothetical protein [Desulfobacteraceae bacterium]